MFRPFQSFLAAGALALCLAVPAAAQTAASPPSQVSLESDIKLVKESIGQDGSRRIELVEPSTIIPGDRLLFGISYSNNGAEAVSDFELVNPLPKAVKLTHDADGDLIVSVDGGNHWGRLADLGITQPDGTDRPAQPSDVTHIRWTLAVVQPGESGRLEYSAIVR